MAAYLPARPARILEIGAQNVNGTLRDHAPRNAEYIGLDFEAGNGVDRVITGLEDWGVPDAHFDLVMASSVFEHDKAFWNTFLAMCRKARPGGHIYVSAPSNGTVHRYPSDHWRFYPDSGLALEDWAKSNGLDVTLIESFIAERETDGWNDFCAIFRAGLWDAELTTTFVHTEVPCTNAINWRSSLIVNPVDQPEDVRLLQASKTEANALRHDLDMARQTEQSVRESLQQGFEVQMQSLRELHAADMAGITDEASRSKAEIERLSSQAQNADTARMAAEKREQDCFMEIARLTDLVQQSVKSEDLDAARVDLESERVAHAATKQRLQERFHEIANRSKAEVDAARVDLESERAAHAATEQRLQERFREIANRSKAEVERLSSQAQDADMARIAAKKREQDCFTEVARLTKLVQQSVKSEDLDAARVDLESERAAHAATEQRLQERFREIAALTRLIQERDQIIDHTHEQKEWLRQVVSGLTRDLSRSWKSRLASLLPAWFKQKRQRAWLKQQGLFDGADYAASYPDVALGSIDPLRHYVNHGMKEGRLIRRKH